MQTRPTIPNRLWQLCEAACQENCSESEAAELDSLLAGHPDHQRAYLDYCRLHTQLYFLVNAKQAAERVRFTLQCESSARSCRPAAKVFLDRADSARRTFLLRSDMLVGGLVVTAVVVAFWGLLTFSRAMLRHKAGDAIEVAAPKDAPTARPIASTRPRKGAAPYAATLIRLAGRWSDTTPDWTAGDRLSVGELELKSGVAELVFDSGSRVVLEGPVKFRIDDGNAAYLRHGKLVARVPASAVGFKVSSPSAECVDLGTEFGLDVGADGTSQIHVLEGAVSLRPLGRPDACAVVLRTWQAASIHGNGLVDRQFVSQPSRFRRSFSPPSLHLEPVPVVSYQYTSSIVPNRASHRSDPSLSKLIDGRRGSFDLNDDAWIGFEDPRGQNGDDGAPQPGIRFELDARASSLDAVRISYLLLPFSAIHAPTALRVRAADGESSLQQASWKRLVGFDHRGNPADLPGVKGASGKTVTFDLPRLKGNWIELEFENSGQWTYLSEISFLHARPKGGPH